MTKVKIKCKRLKLEDLNDEGCIRLIEAIVRDAAREWRNCRLSIVLQPNDPKPREHMKRLEEWFRSPYFHGLTNLDGDAILEKLEADWVERRKMKISGLMRNMNGGFR